MKVLALLIGLLSLGVRAWSAETHVGQFEGLTFGMTIQEAYDVLSTRTDVKRTKEPWGKQEEHLFFSLAALDGMGFTLSFSSQGGLQNVDGTLTYGEASQALFEEKLQNIQEYLKLPKDMRRYIVNHRIDGGSVWRHTYCCLANNAYLEYSATFSSSEKWCNMYFTFDNTKSCEAALQEFMRSNSIRQDEVTTE